MPPADTPLVRPMLPADVPPVADLAATAFSRDIADEHAARRWREGIAYPLATDPDGAFVAEHDGRIIGVAESIVRERLWTLSRLAVQQDIQSAGAGRALFGHALAYGRSTDAGLIVSSNDPRALRLYAGAGFALHPTFRAEGLVDRRALPRSRSDIREDDRGEDLDSLAGVTRAIRGAPYTAELRFAIERGGRLLRLADRGFAGVDQDGTLLQLVARDDEAASALLWHALAMAEGPTRVRWITGAQRWAINVLIAARLEFAAYGALCVRGTPGSLRPFLPSGPFA
jgi:ribosomal protein S18 acetylase RimI-like enzyme